jgi:hypothetical protein
MLLFDHNQPFEQALKIDGDTIMEMMEARLDESLSSLEEEKERLARKELALTRSNGSIKAMTDDVKAAWGGDAVV